MPGPSEACAAMRAASILYACIQLLLVIELSQSKRIARRQEKPEKLRFEHRIPKGCDTIMFPNATVNECGFCVGGGTDLDWNHGKDCFGECFGSAVVDCEGTCGGSAYIDECTGICVHSDIGRLNVATNRDCRGMCVQPVANIASNVPIASQSYSVDQCAVCRLNPSPTFGSDGSPSQPSSPSQSIDCGGDCQLPGVRKFSIICGQCIRQSDISNVKDQCGNCLSEGHPCSCDRDPIRCGCIDRNNCYVIRTLTPLAIPASIHTNISIVGYFYPFAKQLYCIVSQQGFELLESFPVQFLHKNKTVIQCNVKLANKGQYALGLGFRKNVFITPPKDLLQLFVYDPSLVNITLKRPVKSLTNESETAVVIDFHDDNQEIPPVPLKCAFYYEDGAKELGDFGPRPDSCVWNRSGRRMKSQVITIFPTFDGTNLFPVSMEHLIQAVAPKIFPLSSFVSEDSLTIVVNFDKPVNIELIEQSIKEQAEEEIEDESALMCEYLLHSNTIEHLSLFELKSCRWATRIQLIITLHRPLSSDSIEVVIKPNVLVEFDQKYALFNGPQAANITKLANINWWSYEPMIAITGPTEVPICGDFVLVGHFSSPRATADVDFQWLVEGEVSKELQQFVRRNGKSTNLLLNAEMFESAIEYTFTLRAFIQSRRQNIEATHTLIKLDFEAPIISIYHTRLLNSFPLYESDNITLVADTRMPECIYPPQRIMIYWKVVDPMFLFPINRTDLRYSPMFTIEPYSIPANHSAQIWANSYVGFYHNQTTSTVYTFEPAPAPIRSNLAHGINKITIGSQSGMLWLTSENQLRKPVVYQWSCHETKSAQPCYFNFGSLSGHIPPRNPILFTRDIQTKKNVYINSTWFQPNNQYLIGLQVFDANNSKLSSETEYTLLNVIEGAKPQVFVGPVYIKGKYLVPYNTRFSTFLIPSGSKLVIKGHAYLRNGLRNISWESKNFRYPLSWSSSRVNYEEIHTELYIHEDTLMAYGVYSFKLNGCSNQGQCSSSEISLMAAQSATMCNLAIDSYSELELNFANIERCNIPPSASPITYQLFWEDEHFPTLIPISAPQLTPVILFAGTPAFTDNQLTRLAVRVCDSFETCTVHYSQPIRVESTTNLSESIEILIRRSKRLFRSGDLMNAIGVLSSVYLKPDTHNESFLQYEAALNQSIEVAAFTLQIPNLPLSSSHNELMLNTFSFALSKTNNRELRSKCLDLISRFLEKAESMQSTPSMNSIRIAYSQVMNSFVLTEQEKRDNVTNDRQFLNSVRKAFKRIKRAAASKMPLGSRVILVAEHIDQNHMDVASGLPVKLHSAITEIVHHHNAFDVSLHAKLSVNKSINAKVQFGEEIRQNFSTEWNCNQAMPCRSIIYASTLFPNDNPYPRYEKAHKLSPVLDITIHAPNSGQEVTIRGLFKATVFEMTITGNETFGGSGYSTKCHYFDEPRQEWRIDDVHPLGIAYNQAGCWSGHLSSFVVLRIVLGLNADYIIGVLVACMMGVLVFGIMVVFYVQRKRDEAAAAVAPSEASTLESSVKPNTNLVKPPIPRKPREIQTQTILIND